MEVSDTSLPLGPALRAAGLAVTALESVPKEPGSYRMIQLENLLKGRDASSARWRISFKMEEVIPQEPFGKIGKGGELIFEVDTSEGTARLA